MRFHLPPIAPMAAVIGQPSSVGADALRLCVRCMRAPGYRAVRSCARRLRGPRWSERRGQAMPAIIEMRTYRVKPGRRAEFLEIFASKTVPAHRAIGMGVVGPFLSIEDPDVFFWMRVFPDRAARGA